MDEMLRPMALKVLAVAMGAVTSGVGLVAANAQDVVSGVGTTEDWIFTAGGAGVTIGAIATLARIAKMFASGDIVSRAAHDNEQQLIEALDSMTRALDKSTETWGQAVIASGRREEALERLVQLHLDGRA